MENYGSNLPKIAVISVAIFVVSFVVAEYLKYRKVSNSEKSRSALIKFLLTILFMIAVSGPMLLIFGRLFFI